MDIQTTISNALTLCPPFESWFMDKVQVPIIEPSIISMNESYLPKEDFKIKTITFRKNFDTQSWEFESKNFD